VIEKKETFQAFLSGFATVATQLPVGQTDFEWRNDRRFALKKKKKKKKKK
jgi:hypothetical protein